MYWISSSGKPKSGSPPDWGLGEGLTTANLKYRVSYKLLHRGLRPNGVLVNALINFKFRCFTVHFSIQ